MYYLKLDTFKQIWGFTVDVDQKRELLECLCETYESVKDSINRDEDRAYNRLIPGLKRELNS